jgi:hypothetical protein
VEAPDHVDLRQHGIAEMACCMGCYAAGGPTRFSKNTLVATDTGAIDA